MRKVALFILLIMSLVFGCSNNMDKSRAKKKVQHTTITVNLPPKPNLNVRHAPTKYPDGSFSVEGVYKNFGKIKGTVVKITGYIRKIEKCPTGQDVECKIEPYVLLADFPTDPSTKIQVFAGDENAMEILSGITIGQKVTLKGRVGMISPKGTIIEPRGLIIVETTH